MAEERIQNPLNDQLAKVHGEINAVFAKLGTEVEKQVKAGAAQLDVLKTLQSVGIKIDETILRELKIDRFIFIHPWLHWCCWFPWRPIWCWWWNHNYPWYRCCPYWWHSCHWYPTHH